MPLCLAGGKTSTLDPDTLFHETGAHQAAKLVKSYMAGWTPIENRKKTDFLFARWRRRRRDLRLRWHDCAILAIPFLAVMTLAGCRSTAPVDPAAVYQNIRSDYLRGNLAVAQQNAEKALKAFSASDADWAIRFSLLDAEILSSQGRRPEAIALLNDPGVTYPASGDLAVKRALLCGLAHAKLGQDEHSDTELQKAKHFPTQAIPG